MSVALLSLVDSLKREVNPAGDPIFPNAVDADYEGHLADSFWELVLSGLISGYTEASNIITQDAATPTTDIGRDYQQLIVITAGIRMIRMKMIDVDILFRAKAGPVEFESRKSPLGLRGVLDNLQARFDSIVASLPSTNVAAPTFSSDVISLREGSITASPFIGY